MHCLGLAGALESLLVTGHQGPLSRDGGGDCPEELPGLTLICSMTARGFLPEAVCLKRRGYVS